MQPSHDTVEVDTKYSEKQDHSLTIKLGLSPIQSQLEQLIGILEKPHITN